LFALQRIDFIIESIYYEVRHFVTWSVWLNASQLSFLSRSTVLEHDFAIGGMSVCHTLVLTEI